MMDRLGFLRRALGLTAASTMLPELTQAEWHEVEHAPDPDALTGVSEAAAGIATADLNLRADTWQGTMLKMSKDHEEGVPPPTRLMNVLNVSVNYRRETYDVTSWDR